MARSNCQRSYSSDLPQQHTSRRNAGSQARICRDHLQENYEPRCADYRQPTFNYGRTPHPLRYRNGCIATRWNGRWNLPRSRFNFIPGIKVFELECLGQELPAQCIARTIPEQHRVQHSASYAHTNLENRIYLLPELWKNTFRSAGDNSEDQGGHQSSQRREDCNHGLHSEWSGRNG